MGVNVGQLSFRWNEFDVTANSAIESPVGKDPVGILKSPVGEELVGRLRSPVGEEETVGVQKPAGAGKAPGLIRMLRGR